MNNRQFVQLLGVGAFLIGLPILAYGVYRVAYYLSLLARCYNCHARFLVTDALLVVALGIVSLIIGTVTIAMTSKKPEEA